MATHSSILAWRIPWTEESGGLVYEVAKRQTQLSTHAHTLNIKAFVHLIDSRHASLERDENLTLYLNEFVRADQSVLNIYTKSDKLNQSQKSAVLKIDPAAILVSSSKKTGIEKATKAIYNAVFGVK